MRISEVPVPQVYKEESADFRFFLKWFEETIGKIQFDIENTPDLYDPIRCPDWLLWMLADSMGFKYDDRLPTAFNRLVLVYFMSMIRNKGSKDGVTLAAETNLAQFNILDYGREKDILYNRLEDTSIPVNSVYVTPHTHQGFIEVVYFSDKLPIDACIEYVRPLGMYCFQHAGVKFDARMKLAIDARLTGSPSNIGMSIGPTHVGHYSREDYARMQKLVDDEVQGSEYLVPHKEQIEDDPRKQSVQYAPLTNDNRYDPQIQVEHRSKSKRDIYQEKILSKIRKTKSALSISESSDFRYGYSDAPYIHDRQPVYYRNSDQKIDGSRYEAEPTDNLSQDDYLYKYINPGYRALYSLQLCNNDHIVKSIIPANPNDPDNPNRPMKDKEKIFGLGYTPTDVVTFNGTLPLDDEDTYYVGSEGKTLHVYEIDESTGEPKLLRSPDGTWNLRYDLTRDLDTSVVNVDEYDDDSRGMDLWVNDKSRSTEDDDKLTRPRPAVNPIMTVVGDGISINRKNNQYILYTNPDGTYPPDESGDYPPDFSNVEDVDNFFDSGHERNGLHIYKIKPDGQLDGMVTNQSDVEVDYDSESVDRDKINHDTV